MVDSDAAIRLYVLLHHRSAKRIIGLSLEGSLYGGRGASNEYDQSAVRIGVSSSSQTSGRYAKQQSGITCTCTYRPETGIVPHQ